MFERFTEKARRVIFFSRYEASRSGNPDTCVEPEHLVLGLLREDPMLKRRLEASPGTQVPIREQIQAHFPSQLQIPTAVDIPLNHECKLVLAYAAEEAEVLHHAHIDCGHLVLGLLRLEGNFAATLLRQHGIIDAAYREVVRASSAPTPIPRKHASVSRDRAFERSGDPEVLEAEPAAPSLGAAIKKLKSLLDVARDHLDGYSPEYGEQRLKRKPWSRKEAPGHLVDIATAHHVWFVRVLAEPKVSVNEYPQDEWVQLEHYDRFSWPDLVDLWLGLNGLLIHVLVLIPEEKTKTPFRIGIEEPVTLQALVERYVAMCDDILGQILSAL